VSDYEGRMARGTLEAIMSLPARAGSPAGTPPTVAFVVETSDGRAIFAETSVRMFLDIARAFRVKYGDPE
jgi:hypothetical protein